MDKIKSYDVFADKWTSMPNTIENYKFHSLVVIKDKLLVIDRFIRCEVFDNVCRKFVSIKNQPITTHDKCVMAIGNKVVAFNYK